MAECHCRARKMTVALSKQARAGCEGWSLVSWSSKGGPVAGAAQDLKGQEFWVKRGALLL